MGRSAPCFECLERQLQYDFSPDLVFRYGISDSALPFCSSAAVQVNLTGDGDNNLSEEVSLQLVLVGLFNEKIRLFRRNLEQNEGNHSSLEKGPCQKDVDDNSVRNGLQSSIQNGSLLSFIESGDDLVAYNHKTSIRNPEWQYIIKTITKLNPAVYVGRASYATVRNLCLKYVFGTTENNAITSLIKFFTEGSTDHCAANFLKLVAFPATENNFTGGMRHPNIFPILGILEAQEHSYLLHPEAPYTLDNIMNYSPNVLKSDWHIRFLAYQILSALAYIHSLGFSHGNVSPSRIHLNESRWAWLSVSEISCLKEASSASEKSCFIEECPCQAIYADLGLSTSMFWSTNFKLWWAGKLSNYEYLLVLNKLAGRRWGDNSFHMVMPWVIDFSVKPDENSDAGWRDLTKSKWRLAKGDEQLDFTYSSSEVPHHVSDECLSELAVCSYKARRLPLSVLRSAVRSVYEPNEYPSSMQRLYQWTPDECIPEFYSDPRIFTSLHSEMSDLALPHWVTSPEEFISLHREALESDRVSQLLHHWIDITFGYKLSGQPSIEAKNVMLPTSDPSMPNSTGRLQLFTKPHPRRRGITAHSYFYGIKESCLKCQLQHESKGSRCPNNLLHLDSREQLSETSFLENLELANLFSEETCHLDPVYCGNACSLGYQPNDLSAIDILEEPSSTSVPSDFNLCSFLECFEPDASSFMGFQEFLKWRQISSSSSVQSEKQSWDIFSFGCILAELYLKRPLFDCVSFAAYKESDVNPVAVQELPPHVAVLVEASIDKDWRRRASAKCFLESPYFSGTVRSAYLFLAPFQLLANTGCCFQYAAKLASGGALRTMGPFAAEICASFCLPLAKSSLSDVETESLLCLLKELLNCLSSQAVKALFFPMIQNVLQAGATPASQYSHLKVSLLQDSFMQDLWKKLGKQAYLEKMHSLVIANLVNPPNKVIAAAAAVVLIGSSEELGFPITIHQTVLPLVHSFGKGLCSDGIEALVRIGSLLGEAFITRQLLPLLRNTISTCLDVVQSNRPEPMHGWALLTIIDNFSTIDGLLMAMHVELILKELVQDQVCPHVKVLMQTQLDLSVIQIVATTLVSLCKRLGPELTSLYVMPQLKNLFDELAFSQSATSKPGTSGWNLKVSKQKLDEVTQIESRMDIVVLLYPCLASLLGIEKLRQSCSVWFILEQNLQRYYNWKWDVVGETQRSGGENASTQWLNVGRSSSLAYNPAKYLMNDVGWFVPQGHGAKSSTSLLSSKVERQYSDKFTQHSENSNLNSVGPWFWFPSPGAGSDGPDFLGRSGGLKDESAWKIKASILYSARAHPGAVRSIAVCHDECTVYTGGVGPGFKGSVQKWELERMSCISGYYGHDEVVNAICTLSVSGRIASCDGTIHVWIGDTGKLISAYAESSVNFPLPTATKVTIEQSNILTPNELAGGILSNAFSGSLYTSMHFLDSEDKLLAGMGNGSVRFIDVSQGRKLQLWKTDAAEYSFSSLVSAICSCGSENVRAEKGSNPPTWIATGLSSGHCRLIDVRCGNIISNWKAHDGYITKMAAPEDYLIVSSSLDKSLRVWDLRRSLTPQAGVLRVHSDAITSFAVWAQDVISVSRNKVATSSLSRSINQGGHYQLSPRTLYSSDRGLRSHSIISTISILPFSKLFLVGTEDGFLKICN